MRLFLYIAVFIGLLINLGACRKKTNLLVTEDEREESKDRSGLEKDSLKKDNRLLYFEMQGQINRAEYRGDSIFVKIKRPDYLSKTSLLRINDLIVPEGATSHPDMGDQVDVSKPFPITVTAANGNKHKYIVSATFTKESGNEILQFVLQGQDKQHNPTQFQGDSIFVYLDKNKLQQDKDKLSQDNQQQNSQQNTNDLNLNLDILKISPNASINLSQGQVQNYSSPVEYIVTSESGKQRKYYVRVKTQTK